MHSRKVVLYIFIYFTFIPMLQCYNMDTEHATLYLGRSNDSLFGFAVEFIKTETGYELYIGAPKENTTVEETGAVYICNVNQDLCRQFYQGNQNDNNQNVNSDRSPYYKEMFGSTITYVNDTAEVCAYRWTDKSFESQNYWFMPGRCRHVNKKSSVIADIPLPNKQKYIDESRQEFMYGMAQAGFSADGNKDDLFILGAPGMAEWRGGFVVFRENFLEFDDQYDLPIFSYLGKCLMLS
ncbi:integrin alpha-8-like [Gigantopelta aegis]|uniref:integrin alpha-8-like n=1 Tax=Gigantopelta aegis TaxID=1735272 RepID=UPI001B889948|nr:integrin alpha-8-like [Gigantopelta aegis]